MCIERKDEELRVCRLRIAELEVPVHLAKLFACLYRCKMQRLTSVQQCQGLATLQGAVDSLTAIVQQQQMQHLSAADAQQRQLHAFNLALLEQAEELAALQALLGAPSRKRQYSRRRVTEDLENSLDNLQVGLWPGA